MNSQFRIHPTIFLLIPILSTGLPARCRGEAGMNQLALNLALYATPQTSFVSGHELLDAIDKLRAEIDALRGGGKTPASGPAV